MIDRQEILDFSQELGLSPEVVEKDYVLGWLLAGIAQHPDLAPVWLFKGGTCLKKCWFETYRFSEDLDFTIAQSEHIAEPFLKEAFADVTAWIYEHSGVEVPADTVRIEVYENPRGKLSVQGKVGYRGPLQRRGSIPRIKLDLTNDEHVVLDSVMREVHHPYSDRPSDGIHVTCYAYEELFAEKMRALTERMRPRDLYDVIHFYRHDNLDCERSLVVSTLEEKCAFKGIPVPTLDALRQRPERLALESEWSQMLAHQLPQLPPFMHFFEELPRVFAWLFEQATKTAAVSMPAREDLDSTWSPPARVAAWGGGSSLEIIRFAAANRLCVNLTYDGSNRVIEPYALRRTRDGHVILHAVRHDSGEHRSYRIDRIRGATATSDPFVPRYAIELTAAGTQPIPPTNRTESSKHSPRTTSFGAYPARKAARHGPKYVIQCPVCQKRFTRSTHDNKLNEHKGVGGYKCYGRTGFLVETKW